MRVGVAVADFVVGVEMVGVGRGAGDFNLTGLAAGWHTLQVVLLDAAGQEQQHPFVSDTSIFKVSTVELALMDLPAPHILQRVRRGEIFRIALIVVATGEYVHHLPLFAHSARAHFCRDHDVSLVALSDTRIPLDPGLDGYVRWLNVSAAKWPLPTLKKPHMVLQHWTAIHGFDFAFILDVDIIFVRPVGVEILHDTVACLHPGFFGKDRETFAYENDPTSSAFVPPAKGTYYYAGGFYGGRTLALHALLVELRGLTDRDLEHGRVARHHDESVLNRVLALQPPAKTLSPRYLGPDLLRAPPYINCGLQLPAAEVRVVHLEKCEQVQEASGRCAEGVHRRHGPTPTLPDGSLFPSPHSTPILLVTLTCVTARYHC